MYTQNTKGRHIKATLKHVTKRVHLIGRLFSAYLRRLKPCSAAALLREAEIAAQLHRRLSRSGSCCPCDGSKQRCPIRRRRLNQIVAYQVASTKAKRTENGNKEIPACIEGSARRVGCK